MDFRSDTPGRLLDLKELLSVPYVEAYTGFDISADGRYAAVSWNRTGQMEIYLLDLQLAENSAGEDGGKAWRQLTGGPGAKFCPQFSPDGTALLYLLDTDGSEAFDLYACDLRNAHQEYSGRHYNLTPDSSEALQPNLSWSPDGQMVAFISNRSGRFSTYVAGIKRRDGIRLAGVPQLVYDQAGPNWDVLWSPDGHWLAVVAENFGQDYTIALIPMQAGVPTGAPFLITLDGKPLNAWQASWSPDGKRLAFASDYWGIQDIGIYEVESGQVAWVSSGTGEKSEPGWSPDGEQLAYIYAEGAQTWLAVHRPGQAAPERYEIEAGAHFMPKFTPVGQKILLIFDSPRRPDDLWQFDLEQKSFQPLTRSLPAGLSAEDFIMPEHIWYPSRDGRQVPALLYQPNRPRRADLPKPPAVVVIHGGPNWLFQFLWYPLMAHMASRGWVVLAPNYRGSTGYGREWQTANRFDMGHGDTMDVAAGVDFLLRKGLADPNRIGVTGRSHGGYLTMSCLTVNPELWAAGSAVVPFLNWFTSHANSRSDLQHWDIENMGDPVQYAELWRERSPFFFLDRIKAPVQLICGANDPRCPASESIAARDALLSLGKSVDFWLYPDEGHGFLKIENVVDHEIHRVDFLARVLENPDRDPEVL